MFLQVQQAKMDRMKSVQMTKKRNSMLFLVRMKQLASLPENKSAKFHIPTNLIQYGECLLSLDQIDQYICYNNLIVVEKAEEQMDSAASSSVARELLPSNGATRSSPKKDVAFRVPQDYLDSTACSLEKEVSSGSLSDCSDSTSDSIDSSPVNESAPTRIGGYSLAMRSKKILKFKLKQLNRKTARPI